MSGGIEDVKIWDCDLRVSMNGVEIKTTKKRGGYVRNVSVRDCVLPRVLMHSVLYNDDGIGAPVPPFLENCLFERLLLTGLYQATQDTLDLRPCAPIELCGFDVPGHEISNIAFRDITMASCTPIIKIEHAVSIRFDNIRSCDPL